MTRPLLAALLLAATAAAAQPPSLFLERPTWLDLRDAIKAGDTSILVPIGGTEPNGPHMVLGKHNARASSLPWQVAATLGNALATGAYARLVDLIGPARTKEQIYRARLRGADEARAVLPCGESGEPGRQRRHAPRRAERNAGDTPKTIEDKTEADQRADRSQPRDQ